MVEQDSVMAIEQMEVNNTLPKRNVAANIHVEHTQLRDLISCPADRGEILFASTTGLSTRNLALDHQPERSVPNVPFAPTCVAVGSGLVAAGGVHAELFLAPISAVPLSHPPKNDATESNGTWTSTVRLNGSINNALSFTDLSLASSPYHLPSRYNSVGSMPRLFVSNNDCTMRVYNVATHTSVPSDDYPQESHLGRRKRQQRLTKAGVLHAKTCVNHASISPDGRTLLAVGDTASVYLYSISGGDSVMFSPIATHSGVFSDAAFGTTWSSDGLKYAVASQDGCVKVWDIRSSRPLTTIRGVENTRRYIPPRGAAAGSRRFIPPGLDAPLADGSQFMSLAPPHSLFGAPTSQYYGTLDGGGHFGTPGSYSAAPMMPSSLSIPDKEMNLVIPGIRTLKFVKSGGRDILAFSEHLSHVHLVDAQTFNEHTILRVPAPAPWPKISPQSRALPNPASRSVPSLQIPTSTEPSTNRDPLPVSAWCSPTDSPASSPRTQWPSGTLVPSIHDAPTEERNRIRLHNHSHNHQSPPTVYADPRTNAAGSSSAGIFGLAPTAWAMPPGVRAAPPPPSSVDVDPRTTSSWTPRGFAASGISGAVYEFIPPPASSHRYPMPLNSHYRQYNIEEDDEDKPTSHPSSPHDIRDPRLQNLYMNLNSGPSQHNNNNPTTTSSNPAPPRAKPSSNNIRIVHHPATRTRAAYDEKNNCTHLSGMCFDPTGRWMYVSTERSIAEWDMEEVLGGRSSISHDSRPTMWNKTVFEEAGEWA